MNIPLAGKPPMMTHIFENKEGKTDHRAKGAAEAIMRASNANTQQKNLIEDAIKTMSNDGYSIGSCHCKL